MGELADEIAAEQLGHFGPFAPVEHQFTVLGEPDEANEETEDEE